MAAVAVLAIYALLCNWRLLALVALVAYALAG
jgi:hypothetical protein